MKKYCFVVLICSVVIILCMGCGSSYPSSARGVVNAFVKELCNGKMENALAYCNKNGSAYAAVKGISEDNISHSFSTELCSKSENQEYIENNENIKRCLDTFNKALYNDFQIVDYDEDDNQALYAVGISRLQNEKDILMGILYDSNSVKEYWADNDEELDKIYNATGEEDVIVKTIKDVGKGIAEDFAKNTKNNAVYSNYNYHIRLTNNDSQWKIDSFEKQ